MLMRIVVHHAYFLPWLGYFSKLEFADVLVVLDDVGFRRNYIKRVRIFDNAGAVSWIGAPVGNNWSTPCNVITLPHETIYIKKLLRLLFYSYKHAQHFEEEYPRISEIIRNGLLGHEKLVDADMYMFMELRRHMCLPPKEILLSSVLAASTERTLRILDICKRIGATELLMGDGQMADIHDLNELKSGGVKLFRQEFSQLHPVYRQLHSDQQGIPFVPGLSVIDALLNVGSSAVASLITNVELRPNLIG